MRPSISPEFISALLSWYDINRRDLPWRDHPECTCGEPVEPYAVLVSEFMLQQTTVPAVIPYFEKWLEKYPTVKALAEADADDVLRSWEGLGYYSRARNLYAASKEIVASYGGQIPEDPAVLKSLPGIGEYTAAAVASIAYGVRAPALDANNLRVWSRLLASDDRKKVAVIFARILPHNRPGDFNQALMDLGSTVCTPKDPGCPICPLSRWCRALRTGCVAEFPKKKARPETEHIEAAIGIIIQEGRVLVQKRAETGLMAGLWEFPGGKIGKAIGHGAAGTRGRGEETSIGVSGYRRVGEKRSRLSAVSCQLSAETPEEAVIREVREETGLRIQVCEKLGVFTHAYTKFRVKLHVFICRRKAGKVHNTTARWVTLEELEGLAMPSVNRRIVKKLESHLTAEVAEGRRGKP